MKKEFTVIMFIDEITTLKDSITEIITSRNFKKNKMQLIIINPLGEKTSNLLSEIISKYNDILIFEMPKKTVAEAYNLALNKIEGKYINFTLSSSKIKKSTYSKIENEFKKEGFDCICLEPKYYLENIKTLREKLFRKKAITKYDDINNINICFNSYFFRYDIIKNLVFDEKLKLESLLEFLVKAIYKSRKIKYYDKAKYYYTKALEDNLNDFQLQYEKKWYKYSVDNFIIKSLVKYNNSNTQKILLYLILIKYTANKDARDKRILSTSEYFKFENSIKNSLELIEDEIIENNTCKKFTVASKELLFNLKYSDEKITLN